MNRAEERRLAGYEYWIAARPVHRVCSASIIAALATAPQDSSRLRGKEKEGIVTKTYGRFNCPNTRGPSSPSIWKLSTSYIWRSRHLWRCVGGTQYFEGGSFTHATRRALTRRSPNNRSPLGMTQMMDGVRVMAAGVTPPSSWMRPSSPTGRESTSNAIQCGPDSCCHGLGFDLMPTGGNQVPANA
ncbi:hypothetical protein GQ53DRAFT_760075 [Thozetella sp. PMI_491]|nr:hypothetical protein GQ53DRAFT_760075 [Thozetella sp. PMI_491]